MPETGKIRLSEWEMRVHGTGALRVMGIPFGMAEAAARVLWWNQVMGKEAVEWLMAHETKIRATAGAEFSLVEAEDETIVDANGQSVITAGITAYDIACACAHETGEATVAVKNTFGTFLSGYLIALGKARDIATSVSAEDTRLTIRIGIQTPVDDDALIADAFKRGVPVEADTARLFLERGHQLWLPSSEKSRAQGSSADRTR